MALNNDSLAQYLVDRMGLAPDDFESDTPLFSSGLLDSFSMVDLLLFIETEAETRLSPTDVNLDNLDSIDRILAFVSKMDAGGGE